MLEKDRSRYQDQRYRWTRLELLRDSMTETLRLKIEIEANKNPKATEVNWNYEELEDWIKKLAVESKDPMELAKQYVREFGNTMDEARSKIQDLLVDLVRSTQGETPERIDVTKRERSQKIFADKKVQEALTLLALRASISRSIGNDLRTHELSHNGGLWLEEKDMVPYVRERERQEKITNEGVNNQVFTDRQNKFENYKDSSNGRGRQNVNGKVRNASREEFFKTIKTLCKDKCARCGQRS